MTQKKQYPAWLPLDAIIPSEDNPRAISEDDASLKELAQSIRAVGVLEPVLVRPHPTLPDKYELRAGERRLVAARMAGLTEIPVVVHELDDWAAMEVTTLENLQREDLTPLEEGEIVARLLRTGADTKTVAERVGKSPTWVVRRAAIARLIPNWKRAVRDPKHWASGWGARQLELVARLPEQEQGECLRDWDRDRWNVPESLQDLEHALDQDTCVLNKAPWKGTDAELVPQAGSCHDCLKRSSAQPGLFGDWYDGADADAELAARKKDRCLDAGCYERKLTAYLERREAELREEHPGLVRAQNDYAHGRGQEANAYGRHDWDAARKGAKGAKPALIVSGAGTGKLRYIKVTTYAESRSQAKKKGPSPLKDRRLKLRRRRELLAVEKLREELDTWMLTDICGPAPDDDVGRIGRAIALAASFGGPRSLNSLYRGAWDSPAHYDPWETYDTRKGQSRLDGAAILLAEVKEVLDNRLTCGATMDHKTEKLVAEAKRICGVFGRDWRAFVKEAEAEIPEPKSWARLNADGTPRKTTAKASPRQARPSSRDSGSREGPGRGKEAKK